MPWTLHNCIHPRLRLPQAPHEKSHSLVTSQLAIQTIGLVMVYPLGSVCSNLASTRKGIGLHNPRHSGNPGLRFTHRRLKSRAGTHPNAITARSMRERLMKTNLNLLLAATRCATYCRGASGLQHWKTSFSTLPLPFEETF